MLNNFRKIYGKLANSIQKKDIIVLKFNGSRVTIEKTKDTCTDNEIIGTIKSKF